jgi:L-alanine-DL-glutamate epimerase-like enolase superfamily enzyme
MYSHGGPKNKLDRAEWKDWLDHATDQPEGFQIYKTSPSFPESTAGLPLNLTIGEVRQIVRGFEIGREVCDGKIETAVHCPNELDTGSAIALAKRLEPIEPPFLEDPLGVPFSESWTALRRASNIPLLVGEKLELVNGFRPFLDNGAADIVHPDLVYAGGITGTLRIAHFAALSRVPVALHNVGHLVNTLAAAHFGCSVQNFYRSESRLGEGPRAVEAQAASNGPVVREGRLRVSEEPGLGIHWNEDYLHEHLADGEPWWG